MDILEYLRRKRMGMMDAPNRFETLPARPGMNYDGLINTMPARPRTNTDILEYFRNSMNSGITPRPLPMPDPSMIRAMRERRKPTPLPMPMNPDSRPAPLRLYGNSINPPWGVNTRGIGDDITIPPARRVNTPGVFDPATGQNMVARQGPTMTPYSEGYMMSDAMPSPLGFGESMDQFMTEAGYPEEEIKQYESLDDGISEPPKESMEYAKKMHSIQEALLNGADFGYETEWNQALGVTNRMIDLVMSTPIEAMVFAMQNPTDMVLEEFERKYGWPLNVNSEALMRYIAEMSQ